MSDPGLHGRPVLVIDPGMHTAPIRRADVDRGGRFAVTASHDKTVRVWSLANGELEQTIRLPAGVGHIGRVYAVAISPDGATIAAAGWTSAGDWEQIYVFDRESGEITQRIDGLPDVVNDLAFSREGDRLAAVLGDGNGLRLYARDANGRWRELAADSDYGDGSFGVAFSGSSRLATTCHDGRLRLYDADGKRLHQPIATPHAQPYGLAFNPVDGRIAVGFIDSTEVLLYDDATLTRLSSPDTGGIDNGNLGSVAWSADGATLYAAGTYDDGNGSPVATWDGGGEGPCRLLRAGSNTVMSLRPLHGGVVFAVAQDPWLGVLAPDGTVYGTQTPKQIDTRGQRYDLAVSADGMLVEFGRTWGEENRLRFDVANLKLLPPDDEIAVAPPVQKTLAVAGWEDTTDPTLDGVTLRLEPDEIARSLAIHPDGERFLLGTEWRLCAFNRAGAEIWQCPAPGAVWAVNIAGNGRTEVAAFSDGTLRWHRMDNGDELLALFPLPDGENWVVWTPEGVYAASPGARSILRWHVNHGWDQAATAIPVSAIPETNRPEVIPHVLPQLGTAGALAVAELAKIRNAVQHATGSDVVPGARLHVLAIGVSDYGPAASRLDLAYADRDARDVAAALRNSQSSLYASVLVSELINAEATKDMIFTELEAIRDAMAGGTDDLAVILFSGHGEQVGEAFYLLPYGFNPAAIKSSALAASQFHTEIAALAEHGRVILFLDACRSGGATNPTDRTLGAMLRAPNVTVFTSSSAGEVSVERADWQNGAFTEALLEALRRDPDGDGLVRVSDLSGYLSERVPALTEGKQRPDVEIHFDARILVATG